MYLKHHKQRPEYKVYKTRLKNGLTLLVHESDRLPQVDIQMWYNVGSKDEEPRQRGMAHFIEHMLFKGTDTLSESDINLVAHKLAGYTNAFTSFDYTAYIFQVPKNAWQEPLFLLADTMKNCRFDKQMLASELLAVIQEMKMYVDDYETQLIEAMLAVMFPEHPYHYPIIGYKHDLTSLERDNLYAFYQQHYHPGNAALVVVGDVDRRELTEKAEELFGDIPEQPGYAKKKFFFERDVAQKSVTLYRDVQKPWCCYAFVIPGLDTGKSYVFDMIGVLLGTGKSSRLYQLLVHQEQVATDVDCFSYNLFDKSILFISVQPKDRSAIASIEVLIESEVRKLQQEEIEEWELDRVKKRMLLGFADLMQSGDRQAVFIGHAFWSGGEKNYIDSYLEKIERATASELQKGCQSFIRTTFMTAGYLLPLLESERQISIDVQLELDKLDNQLLKKFVRTSEVEPGRYVETIATKPPVDFSFPQPKTMKLSNGIQVFYLHTPSIPHISLLANPQADFLYDPPELAGINRFMFNMLLQGTKKSSVQELNKRLELEGIDVDIEPGLITFEMLPQALERALETLHEVISNTTFNDEAIARVRDQLSVELTEFWDSPIDFVEQLARETVYQTHPYAKNMYGTMQGIQSITEHHLKHYHEALVSPQGAFLALVGDLTHYPEKKLKDVLEKTIGRWMGPKIPLLTAEKVTYKKGQAINYVIERDQVVLGFVAPSIARTTAEYDILSLLDVILTGGQLGSMSSRLFQLREKSGLFYTIGGSLVHGARTEPGMLFIKTLVSLDKVDQAEQAVKEEIDRLGCQGISQEEFEMARNVLLRTGIKHFESTSRTARTFLFLKRCGLGFDLFDKRSRKLSILKIDEVNSVAQKFCAKDVLSVIRIGRVD